MHTLITKAVCSLMLAGAVSFASAGHAASHRPPGVDDRIVALNAGASNAHKLTSVVIDQADAYPTALAAGFTTIDATSVTCAKPTCTIAIDMNVQVGAQSSTGNEWAACATVDGNYAATCAFTGEIASDGTFDVADQRNTFSVSRGTHSVTTQVYVTDAATLGDYDIQYQILTP
jgi:hypothetical protein